jgi:glycosyltransferase involved in cell wall biosynthesis
VLGLPYLVTVLGTGDRGDLARLARKPLGRLRARLLLRWGWFAALSAEAREELLASGVPAERIIALPNGVDLGVHRPTTVRERARRREQLGLAPERFVGVFVGRLHPVKDVDTVLEAAARVPELDLVIVGDGPDRARLEARARRLGIESRVRFHGFSSQVVDVLGASDAFLLSSHGEGMSNALLEAMACGLPCLVSRSVGGARELLGEERGMLLADGEVAAWAEAIRRLVDEPALRSTLGGAAADFVAERLSLEAGADRLVGAYATIAGVAARTGRA